MSDITTAITSMGTTIATAATGMIGNLVPTLAPVVGGVIVATLGFKLVRRFAK